MARVGEVSMDPQDPLSIVDTLNRVIQVVDQEIEVGDPNDPYNEDSGSKPTGLASTHNGRIANVRGSWVEEEFTGRNSPVDFVHNLNIPVYDLGLATAEPNVRWLATNLRHNATGAGPGSIMTVMYTDLDAANITANSLPLRLYASAARTIDVSNPVRVSIFFIPAVRWP